MIVKDVLSKPTYSQSIAIDAAKITGEKIILCYDENKYVDINALVVGVSGMVSPKYSCLTGEPIVGPYLAFDSSGDEHGALHISIEDLKHIADNHHNIMADPEVLVDVKA